MPRGRVKSKTSGTITYYKITPFTIITPSTIYSLIIPLKNINSSINNSCDCNGINPIEENILNIIQYITDKICFDTTSTKRDNNTGTSL